MNSSANQPKRHKGEKISHFKIASKAIKQAQQEAVKEDLRHGLKPVLISLKLKAKA